MTITYGPIVVHQFTNALDHVLIETHTFPDESALLAWLESQETTVFLEFQPVEEVLESSTFPDLDLVELSPQQPYEPNPQDFCPSCGGRIVDFEWGGYEDETGQRGHTRCRNVAIQRNNAAINRHNAERLRNLGENSAAESWYRLADEADAAADRMEKEQ